MVKEETKKKLKTKKKNVTKGVVQERQKGAEGC